MAEDRTSDLPQSDRSGSDHPGSDRPATKPVPVKPAVEPMSDRDEAPPGTPGTGENIDPKTGETYVQGIGGA
ncbi:hypothetical protein VY88_12800 [Azospirillum thiophilum]|uniref:Uncharacterized protein n=1 Tax=Azospirillum thiophilum TaxID=528244 RepID=A0AAC8ZU62_9PROT|nr:hypothetical protein [Azospirillum thiophilum]ALG71830.1 hypothetical protein AL072_13940 [Azospirillum thiophilum]KJR66761.1 hypothetical protein VY88_12800 [Azospirillum thiophilum]